MLKEGCTYFVTFCLHDAVPDRIRRRKRLQAESDPDEIARLSEPPSTTEPSLLSNPDAARIVAQALTHFDRERYALHAWCVMPDHVHAVLTPFASHSLSTILHSWKSFTAHRLNSLLDRTGPVWQGESFDHAIRDEEAFARFVRYTELNPVAAGLCPSPIDYRFSSASTKT
jgi:REP element-mobilizing transposase RayT